MQAYKVSFLKWSNVFFLFPLALALISGLYWYAVILFAVFLISYDFHFFNEAKEVYYLDVFFSVSLMASNFFLLFKGNTLSSYALSAVICALCALFFYFRKNEENYYFNHSIWHILSAGVCFCCLLTFLY